MGYISTDYQVIDETVPARYNECMKILSKNLRWIIPFILFAAVLVAVLCAGSHTAYADNFDIVYPDDGYFPVDRAGYVAATNDYIAVYDAERRNVLVTGKRDFHLNAFAYESVSGLWIANDTLLLRYGKTESSFVSVDMSAALPAFADADLYTPENISYIVSDGTRFYAKSDTVLAVYNSNLEVYRDNITHSTALSGKFVFAAEGSSLYIFALDFGDREYFVYNIDLNESARNECEITPYAVAGSEGGIIANTGSSLVVVDKQKGKVLFDTGITCDKDSAFTSFANKIYFVNSDGAVEIYTVNFETGSVTLTDTLSMRGNGEAGFNSPSDVIKSGNTAVIADTLNQRIVFATGNSFSSVQTTGDAPFRLAEYPFGVYAASEHTIYSVTRTSATPMLSYDGSVRDIMFIDGVLYALTDSSLDMIINTTPVCLATVKDGIAVTRAEEGSCIYVLTKTGILTLDTKGKEVLPERKYDFTDATDFAADYTGTFFVAFNGDDKQKISVISNNPSSLALSRDIVIESDLVDPAPLSVTLDGSKALFASASCFIGSIEAGAVDKEHFAPTESPVLDETSSVSFAKLTQDSFLLSEPLRIDTMSPVAADTVVLVFDGASRADDYTYVYLQGKRQYVETSLLQAVTPSPVNKRFTLKAGAERIAYPSCDIAQSASEDAVVTVTDYAAGLDGGVWARIDTNGQLLFVRVSDLVEYVETVPEKERIFGRAVSDRAGGIVNVYALPDSSSTVVLEIVDGTRMEILDESGEFYYVETENARGYVLKEQVELEGLTTVQIVSIVLAVAVFVTGAIIFVFVYAAKKKEKEKA